MNDNPIHRVEIDWIDITGFAGWHDISDVRDLPVKEMSSTGYLISRTRDDYRIAMTVSPKSSLCGDPCIIPRGIIKDVRITKIEDWVR